MDDSHFVAEITPHLAEMMRIAAALIGPNDAEDALQEACTRAWQGWPDLRDPGAVRGWLIRITVNLCNNWLSGHFGTRQRRTVFLTTRPWRL